MQSIRWVSFYIPSPETTTLVHFFPAAMNVSAPYPVKCRMSLFTAGAGKASIVIDGARLAQPDGIRVEDAFPFVKEKPDVVFGLEVEISASQTKLDLSPSSCLIEIRSNLNAVHFRPRRSDASEDSPDQMTLVLKDRLGHPTMLFVNSSTSSVLPPLGFGNERNEEGRFPELTATSVPGESVHQIDIDGNVFKTAQSSYYSWGRVEVGTVSLNEALPAGTACYLMYRDPRLKLPVAVSSLGN